MDAAQRRAYALEINERESWPRRAATGSTTQRVMLETGPISDVPMVRRRTSNYFYCRSVMAIPAPGTELEFPDLRPRSASPAGAVGLRVEQKPRRGGARISVGAFCPPV